MTHRAIREGIVLSRRTSHLVKIKFTTKELVIVMVNVVMVVVAVLLVVVVTG